MIAKKAEVSLDQFLYNSPVFSLRDFREAFPAENDWASYNRLRRLSANGKVVNVIRKVYATVPPGNDPKKYFPDPFLVLNALRPNAIFCGHSALDLHGVSNQVWSRITAYSGLDPVAIRAKGHEYKTFRTPTWAEFGFQRFDRAGVFVRATIPELTLVEGFRYPSRVGGIEELVKSADGFRRLDLARVRYFLNQISVQKVYGAIGWFLSRDPEHWQVEPGFMAELIAKRPSSPKYLEPKAKGAVLVQEWNILVPSSLAQPEVTSEF